VVAGIKAAGGEAISCPLSITEAKNAEEIVSLAWSTFGRVDILVNNAGILRDAMFHKMSWTDFDDVLDVHLRGSFNMSRACAPLFREQKSGSFIHMTSTSALIGQVGQANYCAAKLGIVGLSRAIALDMQRFNVRSNCISPFAWSRMISSLPTNTEAEKARVAKMEKMGPQKIAPLAVFLGSDRAEDVSGQIFAVRNNEIFVMSQPRPIRSVHHSDGWTPELVEEVALPALKASLVPLQVSGDVFS
jgi:NAD(P)-dependent dehydrogenase (short-subunit alcohol dehydrogenase family)